MLTVQNLTKDPERTLSDWFHENRASLIGLVLFAVALLCIVALGQPSDEVADEWFTLSCCGFGLL